MAKATATTIAVRTNPMRDWQDAALLLAHLPDPYALAEETMPKDRQRLAHLHPLEDRRHPGWALRSDDDHRRGATALAILCEAR